MSNLQNMQKPSRYMPEGAGNMRDALLEALDAFPEADRLGIALAFAVDSLDILGRNSLLPSQTTIALGTADAVRDLIPADIFEKVKRAKERKT